MTSTGRGRAASLANIQGEGGPPNPQQSGEVGRAVTHGCYSETRLAPIREERYAELAQAYPHMASSISIQAQRLAMIEQAGAWLDENQIMHVGPNRGRGSKHGDVHSVAHRMTSWMRDAEKWFERADELARLIGEQDSSMVDQMQGGV